MLPFSYPCGDPPGCVAASLPARINEIGELGRVFNDMADGLSVAHARPRIARDDLEARNIELSDALERLKESIRKVQLLEQLKGELVKFVPESVTRLLEKDPDDGPSH